MFSDHEHVRALPLQKVRGFDGVFRDGFGGFRAVGKARGITEVEVIGAGNEFK